MEKKYKGVVIWLLSGCVLIYAMVVIGAITRLTGSGLSITKWEIVTGAIPPLSEEAWQKEFDAYKQIPQYKLINSHFELSDFKQIYFWEYFHRLIGRLIGLVFFIPFVWFLIKKKFPEGFMKKAVVLFLLGGLQGFIGWFMVKSGLSENTYVSHYRLAIHLISAFTVFGFTFWYALDIIYQNKPEPRPELKKISVWLFAITILQIIYGAFVAGLKAGYSYPTWPKMGSEWFPSDIVALEPLWKNFCEGHAGVQFIHRYIAYLVVLLVGILFYKANKLSLSFLQKNIISSLAIIVLFQFFLGVFTLLYAVPITLGVLHQTGAFFLFSTTILLLHRIK